MSRTAASLQIDIVRLEDKESKLKAFIHSLCNASSPADALAGSGEEIMLVARSASSPVTKAIAALAREGSLVMPVRAVFLLDKHDSAEGGPDTPTDLPTLLSVRIACDLRLCDAHEQLVLGPASSWYGDCMRRDPMKRDAYECFAANCTKTATWARISFERLWASSRPVARSAVLPASQLAENCRTEAAAGPALAEAADTTSHDAPNSRQD